MEAILLTQHLTRRQIASGIHYTEGKGKGKVLPRTRHEGPEGSRGIALVFLLPWHQMRVGGQLHAQAAFTPGKEIRYPLYRRLGEPQGWCGNSRYRDSIPRPSSSYPTELSRPIITQKAGWNPEMLWGPPSSLSMGTGGCFIPAGPLSQRLKRPGCEADHPSPPNAETE